MKKTNIYLYLIILSITFSCTETINPKPKGYYRIGFLKKTYSIYEDAICNYKFKIPDYAIVNKENTDSINTCWFNIVFPKYKATIYMSYRSIIDSNLYQYTEETRELTMKHVQKANSINTYAKTSYNQKSHGLVYEVAGDAASPLQFYITDSTKHFIRGALYFYSVPNFDSIQPVYEFIKTDIDTLIGSFEWTN